MFRSTQEKQSSSSPMPFQPSLSCPKRNPWMNSKISKGIDGGVYANTSAAAVAETSKTNLHVCGLSLSVDEESLFSVFSSFGKITSHLIMRNIRTGTSLGTAFVRFETYTEAKAALTFFSQWEALAQQYAPAKGRQVTEETARAVFDALAFSDDALLSSVCGALRWNPTFNPVDFFSVSLQWAMKQHDKAPNAELRHRIRKLFVRNVPLSMSTSDLFSFFSSYGLLESVTIHKDTVAAAATLAAIASREKERQQAALALNSDQAATHNSHNCEADCNNASLERHIAFVIFARDGDAEFAANAVHNTKPFPACEGIPLMVKLAEVNTKEADAIENKPTVVYTNTDRRTAASAVATSPKRLTPPRSICLDLGAVTRAERKKSHGAPISIDGLLAVPHLASLTGFPATTAVGSNSDCASAVAPLSSANCSPTMAPPPPVLPVLHEGLRSCVESSYEATEEAGGSSLGNNSSHLRIPSATNSLCGDNAVHASSSALRSPAYYTSATTSPHLPSYPLSPKTVEGTEAGWPTLYKPLEMRCEGSHESKASRSGPLRAREVICYRHNPYSLTETRIYISASSCRD